MSGDRFGLTEDQFWTAPFATKNEVQERLSAAGFVGVAIDAPARVLHEHRETLPVVGCHVITFREARRLSFDRSAVLVAVRPEDGRVLADLVEVPRVVDTTQDEPPADDDDPGEGKYYRMFKADARARLDLPWRAGAWLVSVHLGPYDSNRARVELTRPRFAHEDPAVAEARAKAAAETWPEKASPAPGTPLPSYARGPATPRPPEAPGFKFIPPPRRTVAKKGAQLVLQAAFRLPVAPRHLVRPKPDDPAWDPGAPGAKAVVPITLLVVGEGDAPGPFLVPLQVPCFDAPAGGHVTGQLALDLLAAPAMQHATPQRYRLRAFSGELVAGPIELELVAPGAKE